MKKSKYLDIKMANYERGEYSLLSLTTIKTTLIWGKKKHQEVSRSPSHLEGRFTITCLVHKTPFMLIFDEFPKSLAQITGTDTARV